MAKHSIFDMTPSAARARLAENKPFRLAVLHMAHEGLMIRTGGVGSVVQGHLATTPLLAKALAPHGIEVTMHAAQPVAKPGCEGWSPEALDYAVKQTALTGGAFHPLINGTDGSVRWGEVEEWRVASAAGAYWALNTAAQYDAAIVYSHSLPFSYSPVYGLRAAEAFNADIFFIQVEHGHYEKPELHRADDPWKTAYGRVIPQYREFKHVKMGAIGEYIQTLAAEDYGLGAEDFVQTRNGIDPFQPVFRERSESEKRERLGAYGIPLDRPILFSWGRPEVWKGLHWAMEAGARLADRAETVIMTAPEWSFLREAHERTGRKAKLIFKFDTELVNCLLQWPNTKVAALVSQGEPFGLTPLEARLGARYGGPVVVVSNTGGMAPQVTDGHDGFHVKTGDVEDMSRVFAHALELDEPEHARLRANAVKTVLDRYLWPTNILETWRAVCPFVDAVGDAVDEAVRIRNLS